MRTGKPGIFSFGYLKRLGVALVVLGILVSFQNCGPSFVVDQQGQIQYSQFPDNNEIQGLRPSEAISRLPATAKVKNPNVIRSSVPTSKMGDQKADGYLIYGYKR